MDLIKLIPTSKYSRRAYLQMLARLFPKGAAWKFAAIPQSPTWVQLDTYLEDEFEDLLIDANWYGEFLGSHQVKVWNDLNVAVRKSDSGSYKYLTGALSGDLNFEWGLMLYVNSNWNHIRVISAGGALFEFGWTALDNGITVVNSGGVTVETIPVTFSQFKVLRFRIVKSGNKFSLQYNYDGVWNTCTNTFTLVGQDAYYLQTLSATDETGYTFLQCQATSGLPNKSYIPESTMGILLSCFADELFRFEEALTKLIRESVPGLSKELLPSWERVAGLPDESTPVNATNEQRQALVHSKITQAKGEWTEDTEFLPLTPAYYIKYAETFGMTITIDSGEGGVAFRTTTKRPGELQRVTRTPAEDIDGARLNNVQLMHTWVVTVVNDPQGNRSILEVVFDKIRPAHTIVVFKP